jgi:transitional endoplasmic reticulum ATPase
VRQKSKPAVKALADLTRKLVRETSIYKGKALRMYFPDYTQENFDPSTDMPKFIDLRSVNPKALIFGQAVQDQIDVSLLTPIRKTAIARAQRIPLKRGILLHGPWGVGKTLTAYVTAAICLEHGWTFIYLNEVEQLARAIPFARQYQPAVIFAEDLDRVAETRDDVLNELLNTIDGVDSKSSEVMVVLTTNNLGHIDASMLRPGRLDAIIEVSPPDAEAAIRLVRLYAGPLIPEQANLYNVGLALDGKIPAVIREVVERSKLSAINRMSDADEQVELNATDLLIAARGMNEHLALLKPVVADTRSQMEKAAVVFAESLGRVFADLSHGNGEQREREQRQLQLPG